MTIIKSGRTKYLEDMEQASLFRWASYFPEIKDLMFHIPNGGKRNAREAARLKAQGVKAGVSDIFLPIPRNNQHGLWIELKASKSKGRPVPKVTKAQIEWQERMQARDYQAVVCFGWVEASEVIKNYMGWDSELKK